MMLRLIAILLLMASAIHAGEPTRPLGLIQSRFFETVDVQSQVRLGLVKPCLFAGRDLTGTRLADNSLGRMKCHLAHRAMEISAKWKYVAPDLKTLVERLELTEYQARYISRFVPGTMPRW